MFANKTRHMIAFALIFVAFSAIAGGDETEEQVKAVKVRPIGHSVEVEVSALQDYYRVDEPIQFRVRGNDDFHLYVFSVDNEKKQSIMILPNIYTQDNFFKGNKTHVIPGDVEFVSDRRGTERFIFIASKEQIKFNLTAFKKLGPYQQGDLDDTEAQIKAIKVRKKQDTPHVSEVKVKIRGKRYSDAAVELLTLPVEAPPVKTEIACNSREPAPVISTDRESYSDGDTVHISFGANRDGYVNLFLSENGQTPRFLKRFPVKANRLFYVDGVAERKTGRHELVAVYSEQITYKTQTLVPRKYCRSKAMTFEPHKEAPYATHTFNVKN